MARRTASPSQVATTVAGAVVALSVAACGQPPRPTETTPVPKQQSGVADFRAEAAAADLQRLVGRWQRTDGGYVLEVRGVAGDGTVDAAYYNPRPIHVSAATAAAFGGLANLFVEFDDVNYRGSTYQLIHDAERDVLHGTYFQAGLGQTYEVVFVRVP